MKLSTFLAAMITSLVTSLCAAEDSSRIFELRTYYANEGKLDALHARFRDHTCELFEKHGMRNVGYWVPVKNESNALIFIVSHEDRKAAQESWGAFLKDPAWVAAYKASTKGGKLVRKIDRVFLTATDYSPRLKVAVENPNRLFELRTYTTHEGKRTNINKRFRDHTCALFTKHGITNLLYCDLMEDQQFSILYCNQFQAHQRMHQLSNLAFHSLWKII